MLVVVNWSVVVIFLVPRSRTIQGPLNAIESTFLLLFINPDKYNDWGKNPLGLG